MNHIAAAVKCTGYHKKAVREALIKTFELLGGLDKYISPSDRVMIKPNLIAPKPVDIPAQTHPAVILETARIIKEFGAKPFIADSPAWSTAQHCIKTLGIEDELKKLDIPVTQLDDPKKLSLPNSPFKLNISRTALQADKIINLPKLKAHQQLTATIAVKNMFGCVTGKQKAFWHFAKGNDRNQFCQLLIDICRRLSPALSIVDSIEAMEGPGPLRGTPKKIGLILASPHPTCCELLSAKLLNLKPSDLPILTAAQKMNFGPPSLTQIDIKGDPLENHICRDFYFPKQVPVKFSLTRIIKSTLRQLLLLKKHDSRSERT